jgi:A/G-specific adenine glycosylase
VEEDVKARVAQALISWGKASLRDLPWRRPGLNPYEVLVAELLLKRTTAVAAARTFGPFLARFPYVDDIARSDLADIAGALKPVGLYWQRARSLKMLASYLVRERGGEIPNTLQELLQLPGIGQYTARAVLLCAFGQPVALVDSNVKRVLSRLLGLEGLRRPSSGFWQARADELLPPSDALVYNWALLDLGSAVCRYDQPRCNACPLSRWCIWSINNGGGSGK